jgi:Flp pilus assembly pilin Flp
MIDVRWIEQARLSGVRERIHRNPRLRWLSGRGTAQSTVEYALVGALVVIAAAGALTLLGGELTTVFTNISHTLGQASASH